MLKAKGEVIPLTQKTSRKKLLVNRQPTSKDERYHDPKGIDPQEARLMSTNPRKGHTPNKRSRLWPHIEWAEKIIALSRCELSESERRQVEAHLQDCAACTEAFKALCGVVELIPDEPAPEGPSKLPQKLQALRTKLIAEDKQAARRLALSAAQRALSATPRQTARNGANDNQPQKKSSAPKAKRNEAPSSAPAQGEEPAVIHPVVAKN